jgi:hypothetical protein
MPRWHPLHLYTRHLQASEIFTLIIHDACNALISIAIYFWHAYCFYTNGPLAGLLARGGGLCVEAVKPKLPGIER